MNRNQREFVETLTRRVLGDERVEQLLEMPFNDLGFGYDEFGAERETAIAAYLFCRLLYEYYYRVESSGHEHIPATGRLIIAPNHSGMLPFDAVMVATDILSAEKNPRAMRGIVDDLAWRMPYLNVFLARAGQVAGARRNFEALLNAEEMVTVFPEGMKGTGKLFKDRYKLERFRVGFMELALSYKTPIVPTAIVGAEEQYPVLYKVKWLAKMLDLPYVPVTPTFPLLGLLGALPLPSKFHIRYGEPLHYYREYGPDAVHHPDVMRRLVDEYQDIVQGMVSDGLRDRQGVFF